jgi:hypothetical protein
LNVCLFVLGRKPTNSSRQHRRKRRRKKIRNGKKSNLEERRLAPLVLVVGASFK